MQKMISLLFLCKHASDLQKNCHQSGFGPSTLSQMQNFEMSYHCFELVHVDFLLRLHTIASHH